jgi:hypothetical protein
MSKIAGSYSRLATFATCPRKLHLVSLTKQVREPPSEVLDRGSRIHATLAHAVEDEHVTLPSEFPLAAAHIARLRAAKYTLMAERELAITEQRVPVEWFAPTVFYRFKIDVLAVKDTHGECLDWKSGRVRVDQNQMRDYAIAAFIMFPSIEIITTRLVFIDQNQTVDATYPRTAFDPLYEALLIRMTRLQQAADEDEWPATPNTACRWCPVPSTLCEHSPVR